MRAVIIYGPPGSGKGTQANLLAWTKNFIHFDTGKYLEQALYDPAKKDDPEFKKERHLFETGVLCSPPFILKLTTEKTKEIAESGYDICFSGSPRTLFEAFGDEKNTGLIDVLEKSYGKENVSFVFLEIDPKDAIKRNGNRRICSVCKTAILYSDDSHNHKTCPLCGAELKTRAVDNPAVFETRIKEYEERTKPIVDELKRRGYKIVELDGRPLPFKVFAELKKNLEI